jgi:glycosyltransferase involved in cell wall biosynthesis
MIAGRIDRIISVVIPVFNRAGVLRAAVDSVMAQELPGNDWSLDVIVVDDGSSDDVAGVLAPYCGSLRVIRHAVNVGAAAARNTGIAAAQGNLVAFLDSDDIWLPRKILTQVNVMMKNSWQACCTSFYVVRPGYKTFVSPPYDSGALGLADFVWGCYLTPGSTMLALKTVLDEIGPADVSLRRYEDWDWLLRYAKRYQMGFLPQPFAQHEPSGFADVDVMLASLEKLTSNQVAELPQHLRRKFYSAVDFERGVAYYRSGRYGATMVALLRCLIRAPRRNVAISLALNRWSNSR